MKSGLVPAILSILFQTCYALPTLRDDLTVFQRNSYQIERLENGPNTSSLVQRDDPIATIFWDRTGVIKLVVNISLHPGALEIFNREGMNIAVNVAAECYGYMLTNAAHYMMGALWGAQLGVNWRNVFQLPNGVATISVLIQLVGRLLNDFDAAAVLEVLRIWVAQNGIRVNVIQVADAILAGNVVGNPEQENSIAEAPAFGDPSNSRFCKSPIQNSPLIFTGGKVEGLGKTVFRCRN